MCENKIIEHIREAYIALKKAQIEAYVNNEEAFLQSSLRFYSVQLDHLISLYQGRKKT